MLSSWSNMSYKINYFVILNGMAWWFIAIHVMNSTFKETCFFIVIHI